MNYVFFSRLYQWPVFVLQVLALSLVWMVVAGVNASAVVEKTVGGDSGALRWDRQRIELRLKPGEQNVSDSFQFVNGASKSVRITGVESSCGCTVGKSDRDVYAPGERGEIRVEFKAGSRRGVQDNWIDVRTDSSERPVRLAFVVTVPELVSVAPRLLSWSAATEIVSGDGGGTVVESPSKSVRLRFDSRETGRIKRIETKVDVAWLRVETAPAKSVGEGRGDAGEEWVLTATPSWHEGALPWRASVLVTADTEKAGSVVFRVFVICR